MTVSGLSASQMNSYRQAAMGLISKYDQNGDGKLSPQETQQTLNMGADSYNFTNRLDDSYSQVTTVFQNNISQLNGNNVAAADAHRDSQVTADELVDAYLASRDGNHDGKLGFFEKLGTSVNGMLNFFETKSSVETNRTTATVFDPVQVVVVEPSDPYRPAPPVVYNPYSPGPTPPSPTRRPAPPSGGVTPPSPGGRPTPPSVGGGGGSSRPTPPRVH